MDYLRQQVPYRFKNSSYDNHKFGAFWVEVVKMLFTHVQAFCDVCPWKVLYK